MSIIESVISIFAPHNCICCGFEGSLICEDCWPQLGRKIPEECFRCHKPGLNNKTCKSCSIVSSLDHLTIRAEYKDLSKDLVYSLKYQRAQAASKIIARALTEEFPVFNRQLIVVAVPTASKRVRQRGYDQSVLIAKQVANNLNLPYQKLLVRLGQARQVGTNKSKRRKQMVRAFRTINISTIKDSHILLIDDVMTTGSTLESAAKALKKAGALSVDALVFARA